ATDLRSLNVAANVRDKGLREKLESAAEKAVQTAVSEAVADDDVQVFFLVDKSGSMQGAIEKSKEALVRILAGFPLERLHVASFDTMGMVLKPKAASRLAVQHMLAPLQADGGTIHGAAVQALHRDGVRVPDSAKLVVIVV